MDRRLCGVALCAAWATACSGGTPSTENRGPEPPLTASIRARLTAPPIDEHERQVRTFFCFHGDDCPDEPEIRVPASRLLMLVEALGHDRDFFGFVDDEDRVLQVRYDGAHDSWVELPSPSEHGSHGCFLEATSLRAFVNSLPSAFTRDALPCTPTFEAWADDERVE